MFRGPDAKKPRHGRWAGLLAWRGSGRFEFQVLVLGGGDTQRAATGPQVTHDLGALAARTAKGLLGLVPVALVDDRVTPSFNA